MYTFSFFFPFALWRLRYLLFFQLVPYHTTGCSQDAVLQFIMVAGSNFTLDLLYVLVILLKSCAMCPSTNICLVNLSGSTAAALHAGIPQVCHELNLLLYLSSKSMSFIKKLSILLLYCSLHGHEKFKTIWMSWGIDG